MKARRVITQQIVTEKGPDEAKTPPQKIKIKILLT